MPGDDFSGGEALQLDVLFEVLDEVGRQIGEHGHAAKMIFQSAFAVVRIDLRAESFVLHHDVEHVAQHFVSDDIGFRADGGGARIEIEARHFAEEVAGAQGGDRIAVVQIHRSIDGNGAVARFFFANVVAAIDQRAGEAFEKSPGAALSFYVGDGRGNGNFGGAFDNIKSGGAELAFAANDFAFAVAAFYDGAAIQLEKGARDAFEDGNLEKFFGVETARVVGTGNRGAGHAFVGERAGGAGDHAFAA